MSAAGTKLYSWVLAPTRLLIQQPANVALAVQDANDL